MTADLLHQAEALVEEFCRKLHHLLQQARQRQQSLEDEARQLHRFLDELEVRLHLAEEGTPLAQVDQGQWQASLQTARQEQQQILDELVEVEETAKRLDLLLRQVEMTGRSLHSEALVQPYDPWELALRSQVLYGREQERIGLAREVHDGPAQVLSNLTLGLERCRQTLDEENQDSLEVVGELLRDTRLGLQEVRRFIYDLRPSPLAEEPLGRQIERYIRDLRTTYQIEVEFHWGAHHWAPSPEETVAVYRIVQEALNNARQHARAERISVDAYAESTAWVVRVIDDGIGFDPNVVWREGDHWGIVGMRERARLIGADLQFKSQSGEGTELVLRLPLRPEDRSEEQL